MKICQLLEYDVLPFSATCAPFFGIIPLIFSAHELPAKQFSKLSKRWSITRRSLTGYFMLDSLPSDRQLELFSEVSVYECGRLLSFVLPGSIFFP